MARTRHPRSVRKATATTAVLLAKVPKGDVIVPSSPPTAAATDTVLAAAAAAASPAPVTPAPTTGAKRRRDDDEDENDEDAFYGRRSAKSRSKGLKNFERKDIEQENKDNGKKKEPATPVGAPATASKGSGKRLKFDPEIHGAGLEAWLLALQKNDAFEKMISPRKKASKDTDETSEWDEAKQKSRGTSSWAHANTLRKIAAPKSVKNVLSKLASAKTENQEPVQAKAQPKALPTDPEIPQDLKAVNKPITASNSASLTLEKRLQRLTSPTISSPQHARSRTIGNCFPGSPAVIKSSKPLTKPSFELSGDAHMKKRAAEREERKKRMEEAGKQKEEAKKQRQLQERFKTHMEKKVPKKDQQQGSATQTPAAPHPPATLSPPPVPKTITTTTKIVASKPELIQPSASRRLTLDEVNQQLNNENELEERKKAEEAVLRVRQEAAEKGKESARLWAERMKAKAMKN